MSMLGDRLREARSRRGLTMTDVAAAMKFSSHTVVSRYEQGQREPDPDTLFKLAVFYGTTTDYLLGLTEDPSIPRATNVPQDIGRIVRGSETLSEQDREKIIDFIQYLHMEKDKRDRRGKDV